MNCKSIPTRPLHQSTTSWALASWALGAGRHRVTGAQLMFQLQMGDNVADVEPGSTFSWVGLASLTSLLSAILVYVFFFPFSFFCPGLKVEDGLGRWNQEN